MIKTIQSVIKPLIDYGKRLRDNFYSLNLDGKKTIGKEDQWTILTSHLDKPIVYSGGVGKNISFELRLIELYAAEIFLFDPSETGIRTIQQLPVNAHLHFTPIGLSDKDGNIQLYTPVRPDEGSFTLDFEAKAGQQSIIFPCKKISTIMQELGHKKIDILKIDIEGSEYEVLINVLEERIPIDQICVEFHHNFKSISKSKTSQIKHRLKDAGYVQFHKHELEYSFYLNQNIYSK